MAHMGKAAERRKIKRYMVDKGGYAAMGQEAQTLGEIIDISLGGVCFQYIDRRKNDREAETEQADSILLINMGVFIKGLSGKTVCDHPVPDPPSFSSMRYRKRHFQFVDLNVKQTVELEHYIKTIVSEKVKSLSR